MHFPTKPGYGTIIARNAVILVMTNELAAECLIARGRLRDHSPGLMPQDPGTVPKRIEKIADIPRPRHPDSNAEARRALIKSRKQWLTVTERWRVYYNKFIGTLTVRILR
jgi:hypothetical protein